MITLTAKINLLSGDNTALSLGTDDLSGNNISSNLSGIVGVKKNGSNPFIIGASKLGDGSTFSKGVDYFIGDQLSDNNGVFLEPYEIEINSTKKLNSITLAFDKINNRHPNNIKIKSYVLKVETFIEATEGISWEWSSAGESERKQISFSPSISNPTNIKISATITGTSGGRPIIQGASYNKDTHSINYKITAPRNSESGYCSYFFTVEYTKEEYELIAEKEYIDDDPIFTALNLGAADRLRITIDNWNSPKYPLVITGIYAELSIDIDRRNMIGISRSIFDRSDLKLPSFGIISNTGNIEFNDTDGEIRDYAEQLLLESGLKCEIKLNNTLVDGASETIGLFETDEWDYDNDNRVVSVSLKDDLEEWQDINVPEISYDPRKVESKPFSWLYEYLWELTSNRDSYVSANGETITAKGNYNMFSLVELNEDTQAVLNNTYIQYPLLESGSLWQQWTKLCQVCQLHIYKNNDGIIVCRYNGGN